MGEPLEVSALGDVSRGVQLNAASLVRLAAARGIDLAHVAGVASNVDGVARQRARTSIERKAGIDVRLTVRGRERRVARPPNWSHAELAQAAKDLGVIPWNAALYSFAGNSDGYWMLWSALSCEANRIGRHEHWPPMVVAEGGRQLFYREQLAQLVLDEDRSKHLFTAAPVLFPAYMGVTEKIWNSQLAAPFQSLKGRYEGWLGAARAVIGRWIRTE